MIKYATKFQLAIYMNRGYDIIDWSPDSAGLYLKEPTYRTDWMGTFLPNPNKYFRTGTSLAASGTRQELEDLVKEFNG